MFRRANIHVHLVCQDGDVHTLVRELRELAPAQLALDFETASNRGFGVRNGALRLIQIGIARPGVGNHQVIIDCFRADPSPLTEILSDPSIEKLIHNATFERSWSNIHLDAQIANLYDTLTAWKAISKRLGNMPLEEAQSFVPGWMPHDNKLGTLVSRYLHMEIPKGNQSSHWGREWLDSGQLTYAAMDVSVMHELVAYTKQVAAALGLSDNIRTNIRAADSRAAAGAADKIAGNWDDLGRVRGAILRSESARELDRVLLLSRQMTLTGQSRRTLDEVAALHRGLLASGQVPSRPGRASEADSRRIPF